MTTATATKRTYPAISVAAWQTLRKKFWDRPPAVVDAAYLKSVLKFETEDAGRTYLSSLKRLGLIDDEGKLTPRAFRWRDDAQYKAACEEILEEVYPQALRDIFHSADTPLEDIKNWFANDTRKGAAAASKHARLFLMLLDGDPSKLEAGSSPKPSAKQPKVGKNGASASAPRPKATKTESASASRAETTAETAAVPEPNHDNEPHRASTRGHVARSLSPSIHLDFQIHIAPDSSSELIDHIFESMAKHLRSLMNEAGE